MRKVELPPDVASVVKRRVLLVPSHVQRKVLGFSDPKVAAWLPRYGPGIAIAICTAKGLRGADQRLRDLGSPFPGIGVRSAQLSAESNGTFLVGVEGRQTSLEGAILEGGGIELAAGASMLVKDTRVHLINGTSYATETLYVASLAVHEWASDLEISLVRLFSVGGSDADKR